MYKQILMFSSSRISVLSVLILKGNAGTWFFLDSSVFSKCWWLFSACDAPEAFLSPLTCPLPHLLWSTDRDLIICPILCPMQHLKKTSGVIVRCYAAQRWMKLFLCSLKFTVQWGRQIGPKILTLHTQCDLWNWETPPKLWVFICPLPPITK